MTIIEQLAKPRYRVMGRITKPSADVALHPALKEGDVRRVMVKLCGGRERVKNIVCAIEWDDGNTQVCSNQMTHRTLSYLGARVAALVNREIIDNE